MAQPKINQGSKGFPGKGGPQMGSDGHSGKVLDPASNPATPTPKGK